MVEKGESMRKRGQLTIEYSVMFVVIAAVMIWAAVHVVKPSANKFFSSTGRIINKATAEVESKF
jgi:uncharacterized protein (UPF0333 family)